MTEHGIMFSAPMVRAVDQDRKAQTRRRASSPLAKLKPGTILWVREAWRTLKMHEDYKPTVLGEKYAKSIYGTAAATPILYEADQHRRGKWPDEETGGWVPGKLRPSIHMPRFASRFGLKLEAVRIEPLQSISYEDAIAEGIEGDATAGWKSYETYPDGSRHPHAVVPNRSPRTSYRELWSSLHGAQTWDGNPDVVVLTFSKAWVDK